MPWIVIRQDNTIYFPIPAAAALALFTWLLTLHPAAAGRTYAAYGGMHVAIALV